LTVAASIRDFPGRTDKDFRGWLFRIATNAVNAHLRQFQRRRVLLEAAARGRSWEHNDPARTTPSQWETLDWPAVYEALLELDERDQAIVMLRYFAGCSHDEIAEVVSATPGAVRTALSRTLSRLRDKFNPSSASDQALGTSSKD
jgi:RNA polymerase sigma factor (sigma-70 family)